MGASGQVTVGSDYDPAGRLVEKRVGDYVWSFGYDTEGRLKTATQDWQPVPWEAAERSTEVAYGYDAFGRRVRLEQTDWAARIEAGGNWTQSRTADFTYRFVYDGPNVVAEYVDEDGDTVVDRKRIYWNEPSIDQKIGFVDLDGAGNATVYYYVTDQVGSVLQVLDATGKLVEQYAYDAFGNLREEKCTLKSGFDNRYRFHGRERDPFTGQYYYRYRQYDPDLGRFTNPDHQVDLADRFGPCNYAFCQNNPLVYADPMGLFWSYGIRWLQEKQTTGKDALAGRLESAGFHRTALVVTTVGEVTIHNPVTELVNGLDPIARSVNGYTSYRQYRREGINMLSASAAANVVNNVPGLPSLGELAIGAWEGEDLRAVSIRPDDFGREFTSWNDDPLESFVDYGIRIADITATVASIGIGVASATKFNTRLGARGAGAMEGGLEPAPSITSESRVGYHATDPDVAPLIEQYGFRQGSAPGRLGAHGTYVNNSPEGAIAEFTAHNPGKSPAVLKVQYNAGVEAVTDVAPVKYVDSIPLNVDSVTAPSVRLPATTNTNVFNGTVQVLERVQ